MIAPSEYANFVSDNYLNSFVAQGGSAVKFVVPSTELDRAAVTESIRSHGASRQYVVVRIDASRTKVHLMEQVFFELARQVDWDDLATRTLRRAYASSLWPAVGDDFAVSDVAAHHGVAEGEVAREINRELQRLIWRDLAMAQEFRMAMLRLCQAKLGNGRVTEAERDAVIAWFKGELKQISLLKSAEIFRKIGRHNARHLLFSLCHWLAANGVTGLLIEFDITRLGFPRRPLPDERQGFYYTKGTLLDSYELLRQLVDNADELCNCLIVVVAAPEFLTDENRGLHAYQALKLRIHDDVRDRRRDNPYASLVRLGSPVESLGGTCQ